MLYTAPLFFTALWCFVFVLAMVTALMEIQTEGANGWARGLPSWRYAPDWVRRLTSGKEITGYHVYLNLHVWIFFHLPVLFMGFSWMLELTILSLLFMFMVCEDFLWFVLNPHFGWQSFEQKKIWWYTHWFGPFPVEYSVWLFCSGLCAILRGTLADALPEPAFGMLSLPMQQLAGWGTGFLSVSVITFIVILILRPRVS